MAHVGADGGEISSRDRILAAAIQEFAEKGFAGARVNEIARAASGNKQLLYHYFGNKARLHGAALAAVMEWQTDEDSTYPESGSLREWLITRALRGTSRPLARLWGRLLAWEALEQAPKDILFYASRRHRYRLVVERVARAQAGGEIDPAFDPSMLALALLAIELMPRALPNVTSMVIDMTPEEPEYGARLVRLIEELMVRLAPTAPASPIEHETHG